MFLLLLLLTGSRSGFAQDSYQFLIDILNFNEADLDKSLKRLSSGEQLLTDNPADNALYAKLEAYMRSLAMQISNLHDLYLYYNYIQSVLQDMVNTWQRMRELLVQRSNGIYGDFEKSIIDDEIQYLYESALDQLRYSEFNTIPVFDEILKQNKLSLLDNLENITIDRVDTGLGSFLAYQAVIGAKMNGLESQIRSEEQNLEDATAFGAQLHDVDMAAEIAVFQKLDLLFLANVFLLAGELEN